MKKHFSARLLVLTTFVSLAALALTPLPASAAGTLATDVVVSAHQNSPASSVKTAAFSTSHDGELLVAFIATDGATTAGSATISAVTGGGLTWTLRKRTNAQYGTAEIWQAVAPTALANATVTATYTGSYTASMTVATFTGADTTTLGAVGGGSAATGAPSASLTTTRTGSWVWGVGDDWSTATARTTGIGQTQVDQLLASSGDTFWTQRQTVPGTVAAPSTVTINDTAPTADRWNLSLIEILPAGTGINDTTAPTVTMTSPAAGATVSGTVTVSAGASDDVGVASVAFTLDGSPLGAVLTSAPYSLPWDTTSVVGGSHTLVATAKDAAGNTGTSAPITVTVSNGADPSVVGSWGPVVPWPEVSIHAALTNTGKILTWMGDFSQGGQQYLLDPTTGSYTQVPDAAVDLFCAGQAVLADGRIAVVGGTATQGGLGIRNVNAFDPVTSTWAPLAPMNYPRWYPTGTTLGDGRVLVTSGSDTTSTDLVQVPEVYNPPTNSWTSLPGATKLIPYYPFMYQLPDGRILQNGASEDPTGTQVLDMSTLQWTTIDSRVLDGASVTSYAPGKFLKAGTASDGGFSGQSAKTAYTLDMNQPNPTWQPTASMAFARSFVNLTTLPDGNVLATGGGTDKSGQNEAPRGQARRTVAPEHRNVDHGRIADRAEAVPLGGTAAAGRARVRIGRRRRHRRGQRGELPDLLPALPVQGRQADHHRRPVDRAVQQHGIRPDPGCGRHPVRDAGAHRLDHARLRPEHAVDSAELHPDHGRPERADAGQRQCGPSRVLHAVHRQWRRRSVGRRDDTVPGTLRRHAGSLRSGNPDRDERHRAGRPRLGCGDRQCRGREVRHLPVDHGRLHAGARATGSPRSQRRRRHTPTRGSSPAPTTTA